MPLTVADLRAPKWIAAHAGIILLAALFVFLGRWQWDVGHKVAPLTARQLAAWRTPEPVDSVIVPQTGLPGSEIGQAIEATGTYDPTRQLLVPGRIVAGRLGYFVITPLVTAAGQAIVVNRGWLAADGAAQPAIPLPPSGRITVIGWAAEPELTSRGVNDNGIVQAQPTASASGPDEIAAISPAQLVNLWPYHLLDGYLSATDPRSERGGLTAIPAPLPPHGTTWRLLNVGYAVQWCLFAVLLICWYVLHWRREFRLDGRPDDEDDDGIDDGIDDGDVRWGQRESEASADSALG